MPGLQSIGQTFLASYEVNRTIDDGNFTLTLVHVNDGNLTSILEVMSDRLPPEAGTAATCTSNKNRKELVISKKGNILALYTPTTTNLIAGPPSFQSEVVAVSQHFQTESFDIMLSWNLTDAESLILSISNTTQHDDISTSEAMMTNLTTHILEAVYNTRLLITLTAINCAGTVNNTTVVYEGIIHDSIHVTNVYKHYSYYIFLPQLDAHHPVNLSMAVLVSSPVPR